MSGVQRTYLIIVLNLNQNQHFFFFSFKPYAGIKNTETQLVYTTGWKTFVNKEISEVHLLFFFLGYIKLISI